MSNKRKTSTPDVARRLAELRRSGGAGTHADRRTHRLRDRAARRRRAIREQSD